MAPIRRRPSDAFWFGADDQVAAFAKRSESGGVIVAEGIHFHYRAGEDLVACDLTASATEDDATDRFHRTIVPLLLAARGWTVLHASSVEFNGRAVVFMAPSMTGKSTTAYALHNLGFRQTGDDAAVIDLSDGVPRLWPLRFEPRLRAASAEALGNPPASAEQQDQRPPLEIGALLVLERSDLKTPAITPLADAAAVGQLMQNVLGFDMRDKAHRGQIVSRLAEIVMQCPVATLRLPNTIKGLATLPRVLEQHLAIAPRRSNP